VPQFHAGDLHGDSARSAYDSTRSDVVAEAADDGDRVNADVRSESRIFSSYECKWQPWTHVIEADWKSAHFVMSCDVKQHIAILSK
jgi:hypothetical protein